MRALSLLVILLFSTGQLLGSSVACQDDDASFLRGSDDRHLVEATETCGSASASLQEVEETIARVQRWKQENPNRRLQAKLYTIPIYVHIILQTQGQVTTTGRVNRNNLNEQMLMVGKAFNNTPFAFEIQQVNYVVNATWYTCDQEKLASEQAMKIRNHKGGTDAMNVYICDTEPSNYRGWARFPWEVSDTTYDRRRDAVTISYKGVKGVDTEWFRQLLSHEVGHWLGLFHTYEVSYLHEIWLYLTAFILSHKVTFSCF